MLQLKYTEALIIVIFLIISDFLFFLTIQENLYMTPPGFGLSLLRIVIQYISTSKNKFTSSH